MYHKTRPGSSLQKKWTVNLTICIKYPNMARISFLHICNSQVLPPSGGHDGLIWGLVFIAYVSSVKLLKADEVKYSPHPKVELTERSLGESTKYAHVSQGNFFILSNFSSYILQ